jgi:hypothetical protein
MDSLKLWARHGEGVRQAIALGALVPMETASEEVTDALLLFASASGLWRTWAEACPDPRAAPEMGMGVMLPAPSAGRFAGLYALRKTGSVRRSARGLGALGASVEVLDPAPGLSVRGTSDDTLLRGDVVRKLLVKMAQPADLSPPGWLPPQEPRGAVKVRARASRRAVKPTVEEAEAQARALQVADPLVAWYHQPVEVSMVPYARLGRGRRLHLLATTHVEVP